MPTDVNTSYTKTQMLKGYPKSVESLSLKGKRSDRNAVGKLVLSELPLTRRKDVCTFLTASSMETAAELQTFTELAHPELLPWNVRASAQSESYARLRGKLYKGSAALGVTLAGYKQSREIIVSRYQTLTTSVDRLAAQAAAAREKEKDVAGMHLEYIFGWVPLLTDIHAATSTVIHAAPIRGRLRASVDRHGTLTGKWTRNKCTIREETGYLYRHTRVATYYADNPNLWLAERAGLLNPAAVAWDLVPWSFVVNMFVNTGQLVNSVTDFAGLVFPTSSATESLSAAGRCTVYRPPQATGLSPQTASSSFTRRVKLRTTSGISRPPLAFKLPGVNWELAAMAASLFTQKLGAVSKLLKKL